MTTQIVELQQTAVPWARPTDPIVIGKDVLELLSNSMYINPMTIYREYVQNAADAIDEARRLEMMEPAAPGRVEISIDYVNRAIRIRDNGTGIRRDEFTARLTAFGASPKRGSGTRGFRGVGRLAGIGYCQELVFRCRSRGEAKVSELRWDCRRIKAILGSSDFDGDLNDLVSQSVQAREIDSKGWPNHFFEVELCGIVRHRNDCLLNLVAIEDYLSQVAPVPFSPEFRFGEEIESALHPHISLGNLEVKISGIEERVYRPHRNRFEIAEGVFDEFIELEFVRVPAVEGETAALGWVLHHNYRGAIPTSAKIKGLRLRSGNIQVGDGALLEELFPEPRFNSWSVGEVHVIDERIVPNGRRDHYEQNVHYYNLVNCITPIAREIGNRCRTYSQRRNWLREFEREKLFIKQTIAIVRQGSLSAAERRRLETKIREALYDMETIAGRELLARDVEETLRPTLKGLRRQLARLKVSRPEARPLRNMPSNARRIHERLFALIYECSSNAAAAQALVDRILTRLS